MHEELPHGLHGRGPLAGVPGAQVLMVKGAALWAETQLESTGDGAPQPSEGLHFLSKKKTGNLEEKMEIFRREWEL